MRGYPIGIVLLWETYNDIHYRSFENDYKEGLRYTFRDNSNNKRLRLVLDGQQRLSSLYIALYGTYDGKHLYFNVLSGNNKEDFSETKYDFFFSKEKEIKELNQKTAEKYHKKQNEPTYKKEYYLKVQDIFTMSAKKKSASNKKYLMI